MADGNGVTFTLKELLEQMRSDISEEFREVKDDLAEIKTTVQQNTDSIGDLMFTRRLLKIGLAAIVFIVASVLVPLFAAGKI